MVWRVLESTLTGCSRCLPRQVLTFFCATSQTCTMYELLPGSIVRLPGCKYWRARVLLHAVHVHNRPTLYMVWNKPLMLCGQSQIQLMLETQRRKRENKTRNLQYYFWCTYTTCSAVQSCARSSAHIICWFWVDAPLSSVFHLKRTKKLS